jgi:hypothetical protein
LRFHINARATTTPTSAAKIIAEAMGKSPKVVERKALRTTIASAQRICGKSLVNCPMNKVGRNCKPDNTIRNSSNRKQGRSDKSRDHKNKNSHRHKRKNSKTHRTGIGRRSKIARPQIIFRNIEQFLSNNESVYIRIFIGEVFVTTGVDNKIHPTMVVTMPGVHMDQVATTTLLDQCYKGTGLITSKQVKVLDLGTPPLEAKELIEFKIIPCSFRVK